MCIQTTKPHYEIIVPLVKINRHSIYSNIPAISSLFHTSACFSNTRLSSLLLLMVLLANLWV